MFQNLKLLSWETWTLDIKIENLNCQNTKLLQKNKHDKKNISREDVSLRFTETDLLCRKGNTWLIIFFKFFYLNFFNIIQNYIIVVNNFLCLKGSKENESTAVNSATKRKGSTNERKISHQMFELSHGISIIMYMNFLLILSGVGIVRLFAEKEY